MDDRVVRARHEVVSTRALRGRHAADHGGRSHLERRRYALDASHVAVDAGDAFGRRRRALVLRQHLVAAGARLGCHLMTDAAAEVRRAQLEEGLDLRVDGASLLAALGLNLVALGWSRTAASPSPKLVL